jgi:hypothetical protein
MAGRCLLEDYRQKEKFLSPSRIRSVRYAQGHGSFS